MTTRSQKAPPSFRLLRPLAVSLLLAAAIGCGDAVTNPQLDGFDADPLLIAGRWATLLIDGQGDAQRFDADLTPAGGVFLGEFRFFRNGRLFELQFNDGIWDGTRLRFSAATPVGDARPVIFWEALLLPPDESGDRPARLLLFSDLIGGAAQGVEYVRLSSLPADLR